MKILLLFVCTVLLACMGSRDLSNEFNPLESEVDYFSPDKLRRELSQGEIRMSIFGLDDMGFNNPLVRVRGHYHKSFTKSEAEALLREWRKSYINIVTVILGKGAYIKGSNKSLGEELDALYKWFHDMGYSEVVFKVGSGMFMPGTLRVYYDGKIQTDAEFPNFDQSSIWPDAKVVVINTDLIDLKQIYLNTEYSTKDRFETVQCIINGEFFTLPYFSGIESSSYDGLCCTPSDNDRSKLSISAGYPGSNKNILDAIRLLRDQ